MSDVQTSGEVVNVATAADMDAVVSKSALVQLFNDAGIGLWVDEANVDAMVASGFRRTKFDIKATSSQVQSYLDAAKVAVDRFVRGVVTDAEINVEDENDCKAASTAFALAIESWNLLVADVGRKYPVQATGNTVKLLDEDGTEHEVDGGQEQLYLDKGYKRVA